MTNRLNRGIIRLTILNRRKLTGFINRGKSMTENRRYRMSEEFDLQKYMTEGVERVV